MQLADTVRETMRLRIRSISIGLIATAVALSAMFIVKAATAPDPNVLGSYKVLIRGDYVGDGNAAVGAKSVTITGQVTDSASAA